MSVQTVGPLAVGTDVYDLSCKIHPGHAHVSGNSWNTVFTILPGQLQVSLNNKNSQDFLGSCIYVSQVGK